MTSFLYVAPGCHGGTHMIEKEAKCMLQYADHRASHHYFVNVQLHYIHVHTSMTVGCVDA